MKSGANTHDQNAIRKLAEEELTAEEISDKLRINVNTVKSFMGEIDDDDIDPEADDIDPEADDIDPEAELDLE